MRSNILFEINTVSGVPVFQQLIDQVQRLIASNQLKHGEMLPSIRDAAKNLVINPMTVSKAYNQLERDGYITRKKGVGMLINRPTKSLQKYRSKLLEPALIELLAQARQLELSEEEVIKLLSEKWRNNNE